ncbi:MAG: ankyrin repeat domain-containing protein [Bdellovibrionia bacterium]
MLINSHLQFLTNVKLRHFYRSLPLLFILLSLNSIEGRATEHQANYTHLPTEIKAKIEHQLDTKSKVQLRQASRHDHAVGVSEVERQKRMIDKFQKNLPAGANTVDQAVIRNRPDIIRAASEARRDLRPTQGGNLTPYILKAAKQGNTKLIKEFYGHPDLKKAHSDILIDAAGEGKTKLVHTLIQNGADLEAKDQNGANALHVSANLGKTTVVKALLKAGANKEAKDKEGDTPILRAAMMGQKKTVKVLIENGANINAQGSEGETPLHHAVHLGDDSSVRNLIKAGANQKLLNDQGEPAIH